MSTFSEILFKTRASYGLTLLRVVTGLIFVAHGSQKLFGMWGGGGLSGTAAFMESLGMPFGHLMALLAGGTEFFGGLALIVGLFVRVASVGLVFTMLVAIVTVHISHGLFAANNGYEFALTLAAASFAVLIEGAGKYSLDLYLLDKNQVRERLVHTEYA